MLRSKCYADSPLEQKGFAQGQVARVKKAARAGIDSRPFVRLPLECQQPRGAKIEPGLLRLSGSFTSFQRKSPPELGVDFRLNHE
jgi:hypothetical protein